jgi:hypothetical protein
MPPSTEFKKTSEKEAARGCFLAHQCIFDHIHKRAMKDFHSSFETVLIVRSQVNARKKRVRKRLLGAAFLLTNVFLIIFKNKQ